MLCCICPPSSPSSPRQEDYLAIPAATSSTTVKNTFATEYITVKVYMTQEVCDFLYSNELVVKAGSTVGKFKEELVEKYGHSVEELLIQDQLDEDIMDQPKEFKNHYVIQDGDQLFVSLKRTEAENSEKSY